MDNKRRKQLATALNYLASSYNIIDRVHDIELDVIDNTPECFHGTSRFEKTEIAEEKLADAMDAISEAQSKIIEAQDLVREAMGKCK